MHMHYIDLEFDNGSLYSVHICGFNVKNRGYVVESMYVDSMLRTYEHGGLSTLATVGLLLESMFLPESKFILFC